MQIMDIEKENYMKENITSFIDIVDKIDQGQNLNEIINDYQTNKKDS